MPSARLPSATARGDASSDLIEFARRNAAERGYVSPNGFHRAFANGPAVDIAAAHPRMRAKGDKVRAHAFHVALAKLELLLGQYDDGTPFRRFVGQARKLRRIGKLVRPNPGHGEKLGRHAVADGDRPRFVEEKRVDIAGGFDGAAAHRNHVLAQEAIHARNADRRKQAANRGRNQTNEKSHHRRGRQRHARIVGERHQRHDGKKEHQREPDEQDVERDLVGRLLTRSSLHESDHAIEKGFARIGADLDDDAIGQHLGAARYRAAIAAAFADDRCRFAGDGRFVDRSDAFEHIAVARDEHPCFDHDLVAFAQRRGADRFFLPIDDLAGLRVLAHLAERRRLRLAAPFGDGFGKVREQHREPQPSGDEHRKPDGRRVGRTREHVAHQEHGGEQASHFDHEHNRVLRHVGGGKLAKAVPHRRAEDGFVEQRELPRGCGCH
jgi:hypothetical protein